MGVLSDALCSSMTFKRSNYLVRAAELHILSDELEKVLSC